MAIILIEGFENQSLAKFDNPSGTATTSTSGKDLSGSYCANCQGQGFKLYLPTTYAELWVFIRMRTTANASGNTFGVCFYDADNAAMVSVRCASSYFHICQGAWGTYRDTGDLAVQNDTTYTIKIHVKPLNSGGQVDVYLNGSATPDCTYTGDTTEGLEFIKAIDFNGNVTNCYLDDLVVSTTDITQSLRIAGKAVIGAGTTTQWDASAGSNYECVDESPPVNTDYNSTNTADEIDTFAVANCTETIASVAAVQVEVMCASVGSPTPTHLQPTVRSGSTNYPGGVDKSPPVSFGPVYHVWETDPDTEEAWIEAGLNAVEIGYKATT